MNEPAWTGAGLLGKETRHAHPLPTHRDDVGARARCRVARRIGKRVGHGYPRRPGCTVNGTDGPDDLEGTNGPDVIYARGGRDTVTGGGGNDILFLGPGRDQFNSGQGDDEIYGGGGADIGMGWRGDDRILLQRGPDIIEDYVGVDLLSGGAGNDWLAAYDGGSNDRIIGGPGRDHYCADAGDVVRSTEGVACMD